MPQSSASPVVQGGRLCHSAREAVYTAAAAAAVAGFCATLLWRDPGFFWHDDFQTVYLPNYCDIARSLREGSFPLRSPYSWHGGALGGEYQYGIFSVWMLGCVAAVFSLGLSLPLTAAVLSIVHLSILASGVFRLARRGDLNLAESGLAAILGSLNGWIIIWGAMNWFGHLAAFAWLPWAWWALERALARPAGACRFLPAGVFLYLILAAGWPWAVVMAGMISLWLALRIGLARRHLVYLWPIAAAWLVGLGLSAPAWLMLLEFTPQTLRGGTPSGQLVCDWVVPLRALPGLVFPPWVSEWSIFGKSDMPHRSMELTGGLVPIVVLAVARVRLGKAFLRRAGWELGLAGLLLLLCHSPSLGNFRWSFRWLPFFFLAVGLAAGQALALIRQSGKPFPRLGIWATVTVFVVWIVTLFGGSIHDRFAVLYALFLLGCCLAWAFVEWRRPALSKLRGAMPCLVALTVCWLSYANSANLLIVPTWPITAESFRDPSLDPNVRYFAAYRHCDMRDKHDERIGIGIDLSPGNFALYHATQVINGYSPMRPVGVAALFGMKVHGELDESDIARILSRETRSDGLLAFMGVDGLILSRHFESFLPQLEQDGWQVKDSTADALVLRRQGEASPRVRILTQVEQSADPLNALRRLREHPDGPLPFVVCADGPAEPPLLLGQAEVKVIKEERNCLTIEVSLSSPERPVLLAAAQPWYPGYRARFNGSPVPVHILNFIVPVVLLPPRAHGQLILEYRPVSLTYGLVIVLLTLLGVLFVVVVEVKRRITNRAVARNQHVLTTAFSSATSIC